MSKNRYAPKSGGDDGDAAQIYEHLSKMTPDELINEMTEKWDAMDDEHFDPQLIDSYLAALEERDPVASDYNSEASLLAFHEKHAILFAQMDSAAVSPISKPRPRRYRRWRAVRIIAATFAVMFACMITAQAFGLDVFGAIARWTEDTFHFRSPTQTDGDTALSPSDEYSSLQEALDAYGITEMASPNQFPTGFQMRSINIASTSDSIKFQAAYENGEKFFSLTVWQFKSAEEANNRTFEKDNSTVTVYELAGIEHYLMANNEQYRAAWTNNNLMCSISGDLTEAELKDMIISIYER